MSQTPAEDFARYLTAYVREMGLGSEDPADVLDRYHTVEVEWFTDGLRLDRERLIAHARPARRNAVSAEVDVHDVIVAGDRIAARYTLRATLRKGREVVTDIYSFARTAPDGRISRIDQITRTTEPARPAAAPDDA